MLLGRSAHPACPRFRRRTALVGASRVGTGTAIVGESQSSSRALTLDREKDPRRACYQRPVLSGAVGPYQAGAALLMRGQARKQIPAPPRRKGGGGGLGGIGGGAIATWSVRACVAVGIAIAAPAGCKSTATSAGGTLRGTLGGERVAQVGGSFLTASYLDRIRVGSNLSANDALNRWMDFRLIGRWADGGGLEHGRAQTVKRALLARVLLERVAQQARQPQVATDAEIAEGTQARWFELDRPEAFQVAHFVVKVDKGNEVQARALATDIAQSLKGISVAAEFIAKAKARATPALNVVAEELPPMTADGRGLRLDEAGKPVGDGGVFDGSFSRAASKLVHTGEQSPVIRTPFGFHGLLLLGRIDGYTMPLEQRREVLEPDVFKRRASRVVERILAERRRALPVELDRAAMEWTSRVQVAP